MFYAHFVLAKKGPLARIWLAAHWDKKLTKAHVFETNIESSVEGILQPKVKMALRTSGHLLLGIVRIYSRKAKYLLADCNEAFIKIKMAFRPGVVDLPEANREAAVATITLPEVFHDFDSAMPDITIDMDEQVNLNQSRAEDITLKEDYGSLQNLMADDGFEDMAFDEPEAARDATNIDEGFENASLLLEDKSKDRSQAEETSENISVASKPNVSSLDAPLRDDGFGGTVGEGLLDGETGGLFEPAGLFDDAPLDNVALENPSEHTEPIVEPTPKPPEEQHEDESDDDYDMAPGSMGAPSPPSSPETPPQPLTTENPPDAVVNDNLTQSSTHTDLLDINAPGSSLGITEPATDILSAVPEIQPPPPPPPPPALPTLDHTTLINNEDESFALAPLDTTIVQGVERTVKAKRKRKLIVDEVKNISGEEMKAQLSDTTDIVTTLDLAPPTKRLMHWKETGGVEKLFALPGHQILSSKLSRAYIRHLTTRSVDNEDFGTEDDLHIDLEDEVEQPRERERDEPPEMASVSRKRPRRSEVDQVYPQDLSHLDTLQLDASRPSYASDHNLTHPSLDVPNFLQQQMMGNVMHHPPPAHMIQQMLQTDVNQLAHLPDMMHPSMVDQGTPLHQMSSNIHNVPSVSSPVIPDAYNQRLVHPVIDSIPDHSHLLSNAVPEQMQQTSMDKQMQGHSPLTNQMNHSLQDQLSQANAVGNLPCMENNLQQHNGNDILQPPIDSNVIQPLPPHINDDFAHVQSLEDTNALSSSVSNIMPNEHNEHNNLQVVNHINEPNSQSCATLQNDLNQTANHQQPDSNSVFDALSHDFRLKNLESQNNQLQQNNQLEQNNQLPQNEIEQNATDSNVLNEKNDFPMSDEDDDYGAPGSVGPIIPEEQQADETYEQFEERILTKRTVHMLHIINSKLDRDDRVSFADVVRNNKRKQVAQKFYTFLVLKKQHAVELEQSCSYGDLIITRGPKYNAVFNGN